jgi:hypothetical protein
MLHNALRRRFPVPHREYRLPAQPEIELHDGVTPVAGDSPRAGRPRCAARRREHGGDARIRRIANGSKLRAGGAAA